MSCWTYSQGVINVSIPQTVYTQDMVKRYAEWAMKEIAKRANITGSERAIYYHVNPGDWNGFIDSYHTYADCLISLNGHFRDRAYTETKNETDKFFEVFVEYFDITDCDFRVWDDYGHGNILYTTNQKRGKHIVRLTPSLYLPAKKKAKLADIQIAHWQEFMESVCTHEFMRDMIQALRLLTPKAMDELVNSWATYTVDIRGFTRKYEKWMRKHHINTTEK